MDLIFGVCSVSSVFTLGFDRQVCLFSATMAPEILDMTSKFMRNAVRILVKKDLNQHKSTLRHVIR